MASETGLEAAGLIIAGGAGTRLAKSRPSIPKPLVRVAGIPLIELGIRRMRRAGIRDIHLALRHGAQRIVEHLESSGDPSYQDLRYIVEERPLGTIGALARLRGETRTILVANGDLVSAIDLGAMYRFHREARADLTIATHAEFHRLEFGEVVADSSRRITNYLEKPIKEYRISSGTYFVEPAVSALAADGEWLPFPTLVQRALQAGLDVREYPHADAWIDVNDDAGLAAANEVLASDPIAFGLDPAAARRPEEGTP